MSNPDFMNTLYYGDNLPVMRKFIKDESVDLIYLDPPFNSQADYNILFKEVSGEESTAQIQAFSDFWHWDIEARKAYEYLTIQAPNDVANLTDALFNILGKNDMLAYLVMMGERLLELHRVLKPTGSIYLHCDSTASHYLKLMLDSIFQAENFRNEIIWKRTSAHSGEGQVTKFGRIHDSILFYSKSNNYTFNPQYSDYSKEYEDKFYNNEDADKRKWTSSDLTGAGIRHGETGKPWKGIDPNIKGRHWAVPVSRLDEWEKEGRIFFPKKADGMPRYKRYLDEMKGILLQDIWTDINPVQAHSLERQGFQTQKPVELLERIVKTSSNEGDIILDPFCGCGTAVIASEKLHRHWIGIDVTFLAINLIKNRLSDTFPDVKFRLEGEPSDLGAAQELAKDRYQFQWWALMRIGARPVGSTSGNPTVGRKGADEGVDGWLRFADTSEGHIEKIVVQVKSGHVSVKDIRELRDVISRQKAAMGIFLTLEEPTGEMTKEVKATDPYISPIWNTEYPKIQILTIEQLLKGEKPKLPPISNMFKEAPKLERKSERKQQKLP